MTTTLDEINETTNKTTICCAMNKNVDNGNKQEYDPRKSILYYEGIDGTPGAYGFPPEGEEI